MKIAVASDHRGFEVKRRIVTLLQKLGHPVSDLGPDSRDSVDYPDFAFQVAHAISTGQADRGILICGTGIGMAIAANKVSGVRAAPCHDSVTAEMSRRHNDANVLCLSADLLGEELIERMVVIWLATDFEGGRHARRVEKITKHEKGAGKNDESITNHANHLGSAQE
ncbi:MAG: ribose 5-phosphate isomerase B [Gemmataceae bacterium]|nr:ribose 5-phosphate isomerase B [Gemmataceae bacterium]